MSNGVMRVTLDSIEFQYVINGKTDSVTRMFAGECPFAPNTDVQIYVEDEPFALGKIVSIRDESFAEAQSGWRVGRDGFGGPEGWAAHLRGRYGLVSDSDVVFCIRFLLTEINPQAIPEAA